MSVSLDGCAKEESGVAWILKQMKGKDLESLCEKPGLASFLGNGWGNNVVEELLFTICPPAKDSEAFSYGAS